MSEQILAKIDQWIKEHKCSLKVTSQRLHHGYLYVEIVPTTTRMRAIKHADYLVRIERMLRKQNINHVFIVPLLEE